MRNATNKIYKNDSLTESKSRYRMISSCYQTESVAQMYGIEATCGELVIQISALSDDRKRVQTLVSQLNESELDLESFKQAISDCKSLIPEKK